MAEKSSAYVGVSLFEFVPFVGCRVQRVSAQLGVLGGITKAGVAIGLGSVPVKMIRNWRGGPIISILSSTSTSTSTSPLVVTSRRRVPLVLFFPLPLLRSLAHPAAWC
jgi:hypothetical protein